MSFAQKRILIIVISCLLVAGIVFGCYRIEQHRSAENDRQSASLTQKIQPLANQKNALQAAGRFTCCQNRPILSLRGPERAVAISQNCFNFPTDSGEFGTAYTRLPRRFAPRNDMQGGF